MALDPLQFKTENRIADYWLADSLSDLRHNIKFPEFSNDQETKVPETLDNTNGDFGALRLV